ncbi:hypothetical protein [Saccharothrix algeriensis]|uniref:Uncharacterized protein n=1 Tax=Saccharothrix algeriensis TaxID=173560 RepID=A0A8T8HY34_9PSEU|nr:hypothetical protein [Saccharothrix algeriensis]MBM7815064.1 hypothetical protein [Saccharothrix algeriensis]QTR03317.1 hypothetical protein J7S33_31080 [Saccharothrix algeriensis]
MLARLRSLPRWLVAVVVLVVIGTGLWLLLRTPIPTREEAEQRISAEVGATERAEVTASCAEPRPSGYRCLLRDDAGRYGWAAVHYAERESAGDRGSAGTRTEVSTHWDFPLDRDGLLVEQFDAEDEQTLRTRLHGSAAQAGQALGQDLPAQVASRPTCPPVPVGGSVECAGQGLVRTATLRRLTDTRYELRAHFTLP